MVADIKTGDEVEIRGGCKMVVARVFKQNVNLKFKGNQAQYESYEGVPKKELIRTESGIIWNNEKASTV